MKRTIFSHGLRVGTATHPDQPNYSGHARGRKLHLVSVDKSKNGRPLTLCGMLLDRVMTPEEAHFTVFAHRECTNCLIQAKKLQDVCNE